MPRTKPDQRRYSITTDVDFEGHTWTMTVGFYDDGSPCEVFAAGSKVGTLMDTAFSDACVLISLLLQHGISLAEIKKSLGFGYVLCMVEEIESINPPDGAEAL